VLEEAGLTLRADRDEAWLDFAGWRVNYEEPLLALAALTLAPPAVWSGDRSRRARSPRITAALRKMRPHYRE
jgi:hypothetical protein